jgi:hypothetical protein
VLLNTCHKNGNPPLRIYHMILGETERASRYGILTHRDTQTNNTDFFKYVVEMVSGI